MKPKRDVNFKAPSNQDEIPFGAAFPAGHLTATNAGYRTFAPQIDYDKCIRCLFCFVYCPEGAICKDDVDAKGREGKLTIDMDYCKGCGVCAHECPKKCISMVKEG